LKKRAAPPKCLFIPLRFEDTGNGFFPAFFLQSIWFAVATRRNGARASGYIQKKPPPLGEELLNAK